ncbi:MAG: peptidylprolyl isomerase [Methanosarcinales archaeon]|jgi:peptidylprolyl isomerase|nr:peptidylprolyl isomerase [Methanosarcinales archaeon]
MAKRKNSLLATGGMISILLLAAVVLSAGCLGSGMTAAEGDTVSVHYIGMFENGTVFDFNQGEGGRDPLTFVLGQGRVIRGFENAVYGMKIGETKTVTIPTEDAYGPYDPRRVITFTTAEMIEQLGYIPEVGDTLVRTDGFSYSEQGIVIEVTGAIVVVDFNHELAGETLVFEITVVNIVKG